MNIKGKKISGQRSLFTMLTFKSAVLALFVSSFFMTPAAVAATPEIFTISTITNGFIDPAPIITGTGFASDSDKFDFTVDVGTTGLEFDSTAFINESRIRFTFHGTAKTGSIVITANGSAFNPANATSSNELTITVPVPMINQRITFSPFTSMVVGGVDQRPTATASSGLTVSISSNTPSVCTIDFEKIHAVSAGTCSIKAVQSGDSEFNAAPDVTQTLIVSPDPTQVSKVITAPEVATELGSMTYDPQNLKGGFKSILVTSKEFESAILLKLQLPSDATVSKTVFMVSASSSAKENAAGYFTARVIGVTSDGTAVRKLMKALEINIPAGAVDAFPYWSHDGIRWYRLKELDSKALPDNLHTGFYVEEDERVSILTDYLMLFGFRKPQLPLALLSPVAKMNVPTTAALKTVGGSGDGALSFKNSTEEICSVSPQGVLKGLSEGECLITATKGASNNFADARSAVLTVKISAEAKPVKQLTAPLTSGEFNTGFFTHSLTFMVANGLKSLEVGLCSIYAGEQAKLHVGTKTNTGGWKWREISTATLDAHGVGKFLIKSTLKSGERVRVLVNGVIQMESDS